MFKIDTSNTYKYPVTVQMLDQEGKTVNMTFKAEFKRLPRKEVESIMKSIQAGETSDYDVACNVLVGWEGVIDTDGNAIEFSEGMRDQVLEIHPVLPTVVRAWGESLNGKGKAKN